MEVSFQRLRKTEPPREELSEKRQETQLKASSFTKKSVLNDCPNILISSPPKINFSYDSLEYSAPRR